MSSIADVLAPLNAEGTRATILRWCKSVGERVVKDEPLLELETDKVTVEIPAPADGTLIEVLKPVNAEVNPDDVLARVSLSSESVSPREPAAPSGEPMAPSREPVAPSREPVAPPRDSALSAADDAPGGASSLD